MTSSDLDHMMEQGAVPVTSQTCQLTQDQSITVCKQLQQVNKCQVETIPCIISALLAFSTSFTNLLIITV